MNRRQFFASAASAAAVAGCFTCGMRGAFAQGSPSAPRRRVEVDGQRVSVIDVHCHCVVPEALDVLKGTAMEAGFATTLKSDFNNPSLEKRIAAMDAQGIDIEAMSVNAFWYGADRELARRLIDVQNEGLSKMCKASDGRLIAFATADMLGSPIKRRCVLSGQSATAPASCHRLTQVAKAASFTVKYCAPWSNTASPTRFVASRPPTPRLFSSTSTRAPAACSAWAVIKPAMPAPMMTVVFSIDLKVI